MEEIQSFPTAIQHQKIKRIASDCKFLDILKMDDFQLVPTAILFRWSVRLYSDGKFLDILKIEEFQLVPTAILFQWSVRLCSDGKCLDILTHARARVSIFSCRHVGRCASLEKLAEWNLLFHIQNAWSILWNMLESIHM